MKTMILPGTRSRIAGLLLYGLVLMLVLLAPVLGLLAAAVAVWHALLAGSIWYVPLGLVLLLGVIAIVHSHKLFDFALLGVLLFGVIAWFNADALQQGLLLQNLQGLAARSSLMIGLLIITTMALVLLYTTRLINNRSHAPA